MNYINDQYFETLRIHLLEGRAFTRKDDANAPKVAIVNAKFAKKYFGDRSPIGHRIGMGGDPTTPTDIEIVGVAADTRYESLRDQIPEEVYCVYAQSFRNTTSFTIYVRTERAPEAAFNAIRAAVREQQADVPIVAMKTVENQMDESLVTERIVATLSSVFGALATILAIIGLYGVMAYMVTRRSREIGIRMALGARGSNVAWMVMREVLGLVGAGVAVGLPAAYALTRVVRAQLYGVEPGDTASLIAATVLLTAVALLAGYLPARRAAGYDPVKVLRYE
jgi:predicted permease